MQRPQRVHYLCGASGVGTSTRAAQLQRAWLAEGARCCVIATDVVRAQLRAVLGDALEQPDLWGESFDLRPRDGDLVRDGVAIDAFLRQCAPILRAVEAGVEYALTEGWEVVVEGVHLVPGEFELPVDVDVDVDVAVELVVVDDVQEHARRFEARDAASGGRRPAAHYVANLPRIRTIQALLVERGRSWKAPPGVDLR